MGTTKVGSTDWGEVLTKFSAREVQKEYLEAVGKGDYTGWETRASAVFGALDPGSVGEANRELWALLRLETEGETKPR